MTLGKNLPDHIHTQLSPKCMFLEGNISLKMANTLWHCSCHFSTHTHIYNGKNGYVWQRIQVLCLNVQSKESNIILIELIYTCLIFLLVYISLVSIIFTWPAVNSTMNKINTQWVRYHFCFYHYNHSAQLWMVCLIWHRQQSANIVHEI